MPGPDERPCPDPLPAVAPEAPMPPAVALRRIAFLLDRSLAPPQKVRAFRRAAEAVDEAGSAAVAELVAQGRVHALAGVGASTGAVIEQALAGAAPEYLARLEGPGPQPATDGGVGLRAALRGDGHVHTTWSDGGAGVEEMARTAAVLDHEWLVVTDHSPRLTIAHGLSRARLAEQRALIDGLADDVPVRLLQGMEVDVLADGTLDLDPERLAGLDLVVASAHSKLRLERRAMTERLVRAVSDPHVDVLGHCSNRILPTGHRPPPPGSVEPTSVGSTLDGRSPAAAEGAARGRKLSSDGEQPASDAEAVRPPSVFDAEVVFTACAMNDVAVEVNCRPERQDPPDDLLALAVDLGCRLAIHTDAHAAGQLAWQASGCDRVAALGVPADRVVTTWSADDLLAWSRRNR